MPSDLRDLMPEPRYQVNEVFLTVQGEATWTGTPAVFVRLQGCKVGCSFCDTKHTWDAPRSQAVPLSDLRRKGREPEPTFADLTLLELVSEVWRVHGASGVRHVVITGGEPAAQDLAPLVAELAGLGLVQIETSGTYPLTNLGDDAWVTVSPKVNQPGGFTVLDEVLARADEIKHPCATERHVDQLRNLLARGVHRPTIPIWLQPLSLSPSATERCIAWCQHHGWRLSAQTHRLVGVR